MNTKIEVSYSSVALDGPEPDSKNSQPCLSPEDSHQTFKAPSTKARLIEGWWTVELFSMFLATFTYGMYLLLLFKWSDRWIYEWEDTPLNPYKSLQALASQMITVLRISMLLPVTAAMGQLKWYYFRRSASRPVSDLKAFDDASKGVFGSVMMLISKNAFHSFSLGCVLIISVLYLDSATQNTFPASKPYWHDVTSKEPRRALPANLQAHMQFSTYYNSTSNDDANGMDRYQSVHPFMQAAILSAWSFAENAQSGAPSTVPIYCDGNACRWHDIATLAVSHQCSSAPATIDDEGFGLSIQANISSRLPSSDGSIDNAHLNLVTSDTIPKYSSFSDDIGNPGVIVHLAALGAIDNQTYEAAECIFYWQVQLVNYTLYNATQIGANQTGDTQAGDTQIGLTRSTQYETTLASVENTSDGDNITVSAPCGFSKDAGMCTYNVSRTANHELQSFLAELLAGYTYRETSRSNSILKSDDIITNLFALSFLSLVEARKTKPLSTTLDAYMSNVALSISDTVRFLSNDAPKPGDLWIELPFHKINWLYVMYPGIMLVLSMFLFFSTMYRTWKLPIWKSSSLPLLYHGFERPANDKEGISNLAFMKEASDQRKVLLRDHADGLGEKLRDV